MKIMTFANGVCELGAVIVYRAVVTGSLCSNLHRWTLCTGVTSFLN